MQKQNRNSVVFRITMNDTEYNILLNWSGNAEIVEDKPHFFNLTPHSGDILKFSTHFIRKESAIEAISSGEYYNSSVKEWKDYWLSGAAIDLSAGKDPRWKELERRIILSQYVMKVNEAGSLPPQESNLVNNGWYGRFHFEMIW
ncbi:MAG: hypothetical protein GX876_05625 [Bacteroidales bacterium]|nr:hypothetical protein [Bacteroidales bacterium]